MHKGVLFITLLISILNLSVCKTPFSPKNTALKNLNFENRIPRDSVHIVTPGIELYDRQNSDLNYSRREETRNYISSVLQKKYRKLKFVELPIMFEDYKTVGKELVIEMYTKASNPKATVKISDKLVTDGKKYALLFFLNGHYNKPKLSFISEQEWGIAYAVLINNETKELTKSIRFDYKFSPFDKKIVKRLILKMTRKLIR